MRHVPNKCDSCVVRNRSLCSSVSAESACELQRIAHRVRVPEGRVVTGGAALGKTFSIVVSGVVKLVSNRPDGQRQIVGLQFASDFVGRPFGEASSVTAEAATDLELCSFSGHAFEELLQKRPDLERALLRRILNDLDASRDWLFLLGRKSAGEKVATFLAMIAARIADAAAGDRSGLKSGAMPVIRSPLSRSEIADCLSLRLETVSRQFALLKARGIIETTGRRTFVVKDYAALKQIMEGVEAAA